MGLTEDLMRQRFTRPYGFVGPVQPLEQRMYPPPEIYDPFAGIPFSFTPGATGESTAPPYAALEPAGMPPRPEGPEWLEMAQRALEQARLGPEDWLQGVPTMDEIEQAKGSQWGTGLMQAGSIIAGLSGNQGLSGALGGMARSQQDRLTQMEQLARQEMLRHQERNRELDFAQSELGARAGMAREKMGSSQDIAAMREAGRIEVAQMRNDAMALRQRASQESDPNKSRQYLLQAEELEFQVSAKEREQALREEAQALREEAEKRRQAAEDRKATNDRARLLLESAYLGIPGAEGALADLLKLGTDLNAEPGTELEGEFPSDAPGQIAAIQDLEEKLAQIPGGQKSLDEAPEQPLFRRWNHLRAALETLSRP